MIPFYFDLFTVPQSNMNTNKRGRPRSEIRGDKINDDDFVLDGGIDDDDDYILDEEGIGDDEEYEDDSIGGTARKVRKSSSGAASKEAAAPDAASVPTLIQLQAAAPEEHDAARGMLNLHTQASVMQLEGISRRPTVWESQWMSMFDLYEKTVRQGIKVPVSYKCTREDGTVVKLGYWVGTQRQHQRKGILKPEYKEKLQALVDEGLMTWGEAKDKDYKDKWDFQYELFLKYVETHGHANVPERHNVTGPDGKQVHLGRWLNRQRALLRNDSLSAERKEKMEPWVQDGKLFIKFDVAEDQRWMSYYKNLEEYSEQFGNCSISHDYSIDLHDGSKGKLASWLAHQRIKYKTNKMKPERVALLQKLVDKGYLYWGDSADEKLTRWDQRWDVLVDFEAKNGHLNPPYEKKFTLPDGSTFNLRRWIQRTLLKLDKKGALKEDQRAKFQDLIDRGKLSKPTVADAAAAATGAGVLEGGSGSSNSSSSAYKETVDDDDEDDDDVEVGVLDGSAGGLSANARINLNKGDVVDAAWESRSFVNEASSSSMEGGAGGEIDSDSDYCDD